MEPDFLNLVDGYLTIDYYRKPGAVSTDVADIKHAIENDTRENLTATIFTGEDRAVAESLIARG